MIMRKNKKRKQLNPKVTIACIVLLLAFISELGFIGWCRVQYRGVKYVIAEQTTRNRKLRAMQDNLKIELRRLKSPRRISKIAREQLGLITPTPQQMLVLPNGK
jgi:cell division protein FtsL